MHGMTRTRLAVIVSAAALTVAAAVASRGAPRLTLLNTGIRVEYPRPPVIAGLGIAVGAALAAAAAPRRWMRLTLAGAAVLAAAAAAGRLRYRLDAGPHTIVSRGLLGETTIAWRDVSRLETGPEILVVWGQADAQIRIVTSDFLPDHRATLERTIARHVGENISPAR
jgi:hypothetical protein